MTPLGLTSKSVLCADAPEFVPQTTKYEANPKSQGRINYNFLKTILTLENFLRLNRFLTLFWH